MINIMIDRLIMFNAGQVRMEQKEEKETVSKQQDKRSRDSFVFVIWKTAFWKCLRWNVFSLDVE